MKHNPADPAVARPRPLRALGRATPRCCSTRACTSRATTSASTRSSSSASSARTRPATRRTSRRRASRRRPARSARASRTAVGMAMAEKFLREKFGAEACDHHIFAICSDGDLMEGVASEAASLAGHLRARPARLPLRRQRDHDRRRRPTSRSRPRTSQKRFEAYGWHTLRGRGRQRPGGDRGGDPRRDRRGGAPDADPPAAP